MWATDNGPKCICEGTIWTYLQGNNYEYTAKCQSCRYMERFSYYNNEDPSVIELREAHETDRAHKEKHGLASVSITRVFRNGERFTLQYTYLDGTTGSVNKYFTFEELGKYLTNDLRKTSL